MTPAIRRWSSVSLILLTLPIVGRKQVPAPSPQGEALLRPVPIQKAFLDSVTNIGDVRFEDATHVVFTDPRELRVHRADLGAGTAERFGGPGSGPGEFQACSGMALLDDGGVVVWDSRLMRLSRFFGDGRLEGATRLEFAFPMGARIAALPDGRLALLPGGTEMKSEYHGRILLLGADLQLQTTFPCDCTGRVAAMEDVYGVSQCDRVLATGAGGTLLVGDSYTYTLRRYDSDGHVLWDSGQLDVDFQEPASSSRDRGKGATPVVFTSPRNGLSTLLEVPGHGFVVGGYFMQRRYETGTAAEPVGFVDFRGPDGKLLYRHPLQAGWMLADAMVDGDRIRLVTYDPGRNALPDMELLDCDIKGLTW